MAAGVINLTWNPAVSRFVPVQAAEPAPPENPVVLPLNLRIASLAESTIAEVLRLRVLGPSNQVLLDKSAAEHKITYWHAWRGSRCAVLVVRDIMPFRSTTAGDAPCTTGRYAVSVVFEDEGLQDSERAVAEKVFAETFKTIGDENQTVRPDRKGWIRLEKASLARQEPQSVGEKPTCAMNLTIAVESQKVSHPLTPNEAARFQQVRWTNRALWRKSICVKAIFDAQEAETAVTRMLREGAAKALLEAQMERTRGLRAQQDYLEHRAEEAARIAKVWKKAAYGPASP